MISSWTSKKLIQAFLAKHYSSATVGKSLLRYAIVDTRHVSGLVSVICWQNFKGRLLHHRTGAVVQKSWQGQVVGLRRAEKEREREREREIEWKTQCPFALSSSHWKVLIFSQTFQACMLFYSGERERVCERECERESVCVRERESERERESVCERERDEQWARWLNLQFNNIWSVFFFFSERQETRLRR